MLGMWHKSTYECGVAVSGWIVSTRPIAVMWITDCAGWQYLYATSDSSLCLVIPNLLWIIGECQGYAVYLIRTIEKGIVLVLAQYLQAIVATRPTPPAAFVFLDFLRAAGINDHSKCPESWPVTQLNLLHSISTVRVMTTTSNLGRLCLLHLNHKINQ